ncbi:hypothetical protein [Pseudomonas poae]|uniref:Uncharacterized protein n=1 Tax=Pseudomonas poae TaxID=200451 RepID=A0A2S9F0D9_9PSED|nr:hypothetical protein [Pseudomonas poae]PRA31458.1 hypothetical protein CQZ97_08500 [Pseudomonas poae]PRC23064.1 hypothetical protein CQZ99_01400 [Pseudomonas poae]
MNTENLRKTSALTEFFTNTPVETRREILMGVINKANASQREVVQKAEAIKAERLSVQDS